MVILLLLLLLSFNFDWEDISNTRDSVSSAIQTPQISSKILCCTLSFQLSSLGYPNETLSLMSDMIQEPFTRRHSKHDQVCLPLPTIAKCSSSFVFASTVSSILFSNARFTAWHWAWRSLKACMRIPSIMLRRFMAEFFSRSALRMFLLEKSSHSSGVTELIRSKK